MLSYADANTVSVSHRSPVPKYYTGLYLFSHSYERESKCLRFRGRLLNIPYFTNLADEMFQNLIEFLSLDTSEDPFFDPEPN